MKRLYVDRLELRKVLEEISESQRKQNCFENVVAKPYTGKKRGENIVTITIG